MPVPNPGDVHLVAPVGRRPPRRLDRLVRLDTAVMRVLATQLDRIDRKAPLPRHAVDAVNAALQRAAPLCARMPRRLRPAPFPRETPVRPADAFLALLKIHDTLGALADALPGPAGGNPADPRFQPPQ